MSEDRMLAEVVASAMDKAAPHTSRFCLCGVPGDADYNAISSGSLSQEVDKATPTIRVSTSVTPAPIGASITFTATLSSGPSGTVTFYDGANAIGTGTISGTTATFAISSLSVGTHDVSVSWPGNADYNAVSSGSVVQAVGPILYSYTVPAGGYDGAGNVLSYADSVMGAWNLSYDTLNRLTGATDTQPNNPDTNYCWGYDPYGNRTIQAGSSAAFAVASPAPSGSDPCQPASSASYDSYWAHQSTSNNNQLAGTTQAPGGVLQDAAGEVQADGKNQYLYDGDGRICAVKDGSGAMTGYIYNADGQRVAKGNITGGWPTQAVFACVG